MEYRRFGKTEFRMPVISCGGMRYQHSWKGSDEVPPESQESVEACIFRALELGINHFETARGYGTSEEQLGRILPKIPRDEILVQTKVGPSDDLDKFKEAFEKSIGLLKMDYLDIFSFHGINNEETLEQALHCMPTVQAWKKEGRIRAIGFSTHGPCNATVKAIETGLFDSINLHWYYIFQENWPAIEAATRHDMGVFIISPNDKGGKLYEPSDKLVELCDPLHPMVFNGLFCLSHPEVHTLSCGVARASDFDVHMDTIENLGRAQEAIAPIIERLESEMAKVLGTEWAQSWEDGLPGLSDTPESINIRWILRLRNLALAYDMYAYGKMRYNMLGNGGHWFPGNNAEKADEIDFSVCLRNSPHADTIPAALAEAHALLSGKEGKRLQES